MLKTFVHFVQNAVTALKKQSREINSVMWVLFSTGWKNEQIILYKKNQRQKIQKNVFKQPLFSSLGVVFCIYMFNWF